MSIKKLLALSLISVLSMKAGVALAKSNYNFLLGVQAGAESRKGEFATSYTTAAPAPVLTTSQGARESVTDSGAVLGVLGGLQWQCERLVLGLEASADFQSFEMNRPLLFGPEVGGPAAIYSGTVVYDRGPTLSFSGRAGWFVTPFFMPYVRVGGQYSEDELSYQLNVFAAGQPPAIPDYSSTKHDVWGWNLGLGVEFPLFGPSTLRVEANYIKTDDTQINDSVGPVFGTHQYQSPRSYAGKIAWVWNFK
jgi:opacity protein-like surface antigen